jgi:two-component system response regulator YesN
VCKSDSCWPDEKRRCTMRFLKRIQHYRIYRRLVLSYLILIAITISLLCSLLYILFSAKAVKEIDVSSREMLSQVSYTADVVVKQVKDITSQLLNDNQILTFMYSYKDNKELNYSVSNLLAKVQSVYPFIYNMSLYNFTTGASVDVVGLPFDPPIINQNQQKQYIELYPRKERGFNNEQLQLLTFQIIPEYSFVGSSKSAIVLDLKEVYIQNTIRSISATFRDASNFVMNAKGTIISHSSAEHFMADFSQKDYVQRILAGTESQGSFVQKIDHKKNLVTYVKSTSLDWYFISVRPYDQLLSNLYELRNWTLLIALILFIIGVIISLLVTGNIYNPIKVLVDKVSEHGAFDKAPLLRLDEYKLLTEAFTSNMESAKILETSLFRSSQMLKSSYIFNLLKGNTEEAAFSSDAELAWLNRLKGPYYKVLLFKIDAFRLFKENYNAFDRGLIRFAISNIAQELLSRAYISDIAIMEEDETVLIIQTDLLDDDDHLYLILAEIQDAVQMYYNITVSVSIGDSCASIPEIRRTYLSAQMYLTYRLFWGHNSLLDVTKASREHTHSSRYPSTRERKLIDAIKLCHPKSIQKEINDWITYISSTSYSQAIQYTNFLFLAIIREFENITEWWEVDPNDLYLAINEIHYAETVGEIQKKLTEFCLHIVSIIEENKNNVSALKNAKVIEEIKQFLHERFADPGLSLELASEQVGLSAGYIGKLFKHVTGLSFNDYVSNIRLNKAKILLVETTDSVAQIGECVGIFNVSYFSTLFKKKYGMTPSQFREQPQNDA